MHATATPSATALLEPLLQQSQQLFFVFHLETHCLTYVSPASEGLLGQPADDFLGGDDAAAAALAAVVARVHPDDQTYAARCFRHLLRSGYLEGVELRLQRGPDRAPQWLTVSVARAEYGPGQTYLSGSVLDQTVLREHLDNTDRFNKKKNATLEILAHDLAGPFAMMQQLTDFVTDKVEPLHDPKLEELLQVMKTTCQDSITLIHDFVDNEFMESSNVVLRRERVDLVPGMREMLEEYQRAEASLGRQFHFEPLQPTICLDLDNNKFMQVMNNLLSNALKFTPPGSRITIRLEEAGPDVLIRVADNGVGIPAALLPRLYERFTPARRPGLRGERTTGLGMSIIKTIVELHHGRISCQSTEGQGTTFTIRLPRPLVVEEEETEQG
ncbi:PAS domain-containing sensor histidine kinase [Hymenobacter rubripertinctus]|uniref:PAS domain-containing sensor histidine kinase n=1 Tax=Hymenobacter rubripertinctus TaxID=2029981 RepID=UPI0016030FB4|nr:ATP-binding protein [Hymenobacter rubripertinctus]